MGVEGCEEAREGDLTVRVNGELRRRLRADGAPYTCGRATEGPRHIHLGPGDGHTDPDVSRTALSMRSRGGAWSVRNESRMRPVAVKHGTRVVRLLQPATGDRSTPWWPIGDDGVAVELVTATMSYRLDLEPVPVSTSDPRPAVPDDGLGADTPAPLPPARAYDRMVLAAKFLSRRNAGDAIGDLRAAERITRWGRWPCEVPAKTIENVARHWRELLDDAGVHGLEGRSNVDRLGEWLLAFGVITEDDRLGGPPEEDLPERPRRT